VKYRLHAPDPSLAVAHGSFWKYPQKAYAWELRLQDEIRAGFAIVRMPLTRMGRTEEPEA